MVCLAERLLTQRAQGGGRAPPRSQPPVRLQTRGACQDLAFTYDSSSPRSGLILLKLGRCARVCNAHARCCSHGRCRYLCMIQAIICLADSSVWLGWARRATCQCRASLLCFRSCKYMVPHAHSWHTAVRARLELVDAVLAASSKDVLRGLPGAIRIRQVLPLRQHTD